ncbi:uncharacterized protein LOC143212386 [Lasioglossum baleicum]|uniref:uncharacterized protein LOC143212386 n=1 Tax=Lasioglossum baleicum TaxID=434251 RepID=UPI003FCCB66C
MAEKYVKEILEKLEEIEKLHVKLRSMVARIKKQETGSSADVDRRSSKPKKKKVSITSKEKERNSWKEKPSDIGIDAEKLQNPQGSKYLKKLGGNSLNFVAEQWRDKKEKMKGFLISLVERDTIFVTRASQTSDSIVPKAMPDAQQTGNENSEFPWKEMRYVRNRVSTQEL